jgi:hypothetical protein
MSLVCWFLGFTCGRPICGIPALVAGGVEPQVPPLRSHGKPGQAG